jgi:hypothetical protein
VSNKLKSQKQKLKIESSIGETLLTFEF